MLQGPLGCRRRGQGPLLWQPTQTSRVQRVPRVRGPIRNSLGETTEIARFSQMNGGTQHVISRCLSHAGRTSIGCPRLVSRASKMHAPDLNLRCRSSLGFLSTIRISPNESTGVRPGILCRSAPSLAVQASMPKYRSGDREPVGLDVIDQSIDEAEAFARKRGIADSLGGLRHWRRPRDASRPRAGAEPPARGLGRRLSGRREIRLSKHPSTPDWEPDQGRGWMLGASPIPWVHDALDARQPSASLLWTQPVRPHPSDTGH